MMDALAGRLAAFHRSASQGSGVSVHADPERLASRWKSVLSSAAPFAGVLLEPKDHEVLTDFGPAFIRAHEPLLRARQRAGRIREGHGDLHAEHVCFVDAPVEAEGELLPLEPGIYVFDCIEFSQPLRSNDVAYEIAFLAMDLDSLERPDLARRLVAAYVVAADDPDVRLLLPLDACHLASVRGMVEGLKSAEAEVEPADREAAAARARRHFALAVRYAWTTDGPAVIACTGLSGTGKTTLAAELARTTGFTLLGTDTLRKQRAGLAPEAPARAAYGAGLYTEEARAATYAALVAEVDAALEGGRGVIVDATFIRRADRDRPRASGAPSGAAVRLRHLPSRRAGGPCPVGGARGRALGLRRPLGDIRGATRAVRAVRGRGTALGRRHRWRSGDRARGGAACPVAVAAGTRHARLRPKSAVATPRFRSAPVTRSLSPTCSATSFRAARSQSRRATR